MEELQGIVAHITYHNEENGYAVLYINNDDGRHAIVGTIPSIRKGDCIKVTGKYVVDKRYGKQFSCSSVEFVAPSTIAGIEAYLASGVIRGVGEKLAKRIVAVFKEKTLEILDTNPHELSKVRGISKKVIEGIEESWQEQSSVRSLIMFLQPYGVSPKMAVRIYKTYGLDAEEKIKKNPYVLAMDVKGIGFTTADEIAMRFGFARDSIFRVQACVLYVLSEYTDKGNMYCPRDILSRLVQEKIPEPTEAIIQQGIQELAKQKNTIIIEEYEDEIAVYLHYNYRYEKRIAYYLQRLINSPRVMNEESLQSQVNAVLEASPIELSLEQIHAVKESTKNKVMVLTGGPGTGKTTITNCILNVFAKENAKILLSAPTGRAAKRMSETTKREAKTLHRLLEYNPKEDAFAHNEDNPLSCALLVIDECSMVDSMLMYYVLRAIPLGATVIFVGDSNQLPSVGAGNILGDMIDSGIIPVVALTEIFRQAKESRIICNAHKVNKGEMPDIEHPQILSDFYFIPAIEPETIVNTVVQYVKEHIPRRFGLHPVKDIQVLTPMLKGTTGVEELNKALQKALNPKNASIQRGTVSFHLDDKVMQIKNNYDKDVFNGDIGYICALNAEEKELTIRFDDRNVLYSFDELHEVIPAYSISIHKSQGSEYPAVVIPISMQHFMLLERNLVYTAITRGKKLVIVIGQPKAMAMAVKKNSIKKRFTRLVPRLQGRIYKE